MSEDSATYAENIRSYLAQKGGGIQDAEGRGLGEEIARAIGIDKVTMVGPILDQMEHDGLITREKRGFRTYRIDLVPSATPADNGAPAAPSPGETTSPTDAPDMPPPPTGAGDAPDIAPPPTVAGDAPDMPPPPPAAPTTAISLRQALAAAGAAPETAPETGTVEPPRYAGVGARRTSRFAQPPPVPQSPAMAPPVDDAGATKDILPAVGTAPARPRLRVAIPEVKRVPSTTIILAVGGAMAALILVAVLSVVLSRGNVHHAPAAGSLASSTDACQVVPPSAASSAFGDTAGVPHLVLGSCVYDDGTHELIVGIARNNARAQFASSRPPEAMDVPGVGDTAYYTNGRLWILKGPNLLLLTLTPFSPTAPSPQLLALAVSSVARL